MNVVLPCDLNSEISERLQSAILSCMHLRLDESRKIAIDNGFEGFAQLRVELAALIGEVDWRRLRPHRPHRLISLFSLFRSRF